MKKTAITLILTAFTGSAFATTIEDMGKTYGIVKGCEAVYTGAGFTGQAQIMTRVANTFEQRLGDISGTENGVRFNDAAQQRVYEMEQLSHNSILSLCSSAIASAERNGL